MKLRNLIAAAMIAIMPLAVTSFASAETFNDGGSNCSVVELGAKDGGSFTVHGNTATTSVQVKGPTSCKETVSLASWNTAFGSNSFRPLEGQRYVAGATFTNLGVGKHNLSVFVNSSCNFQADIVLGHNPLGSRNNANYGTELMGYTQVFSGVCQAPSTPAAAPTPTAPAAPTPAPTTTTVSVCSGDTVNAGIGSQGGNCSSNTTTVQTPPTTPTSPTPAPSAPVATPAAAVVAQPAALVNTGPGNIVALFGIATVGGYFIHRKLMQRAF